MADLPIPPVFTLSPPVLTDYSYEFYSIRKQFNIINGEEQFGSGKDELQKKYKHKFEKAEEGAKETQYSDELGMINITLLRHCTRCDRWILKTEYDIHLSCHAAIVEPNLLLGCKFCAQSRKELIERMGVTHVLNAASELSNFLEKEPQGLKYLKLELCDNLGESLFPEMDKAYDFIKQAHEQNGVVFVHCAMGKSRSVSAILIYLLRAKGLSIAEGLQKVRKVRSIAKPNINYMNQLLEYEKSLGAVEQIITD